MSERPDVRVGSNGNAFAPLLVGRRSFRPDACSWTMLVVLASTAVALDRVSKDAIGERLMYGSDRRLFGPLSLTHTTNSGIAFGLFPGRASLVALFGLVAVAAMIVSFARLGADDGRLAVPIGLLLGGTIGNLLDRLRFGRVTDFVELRFWPAFNLADVFVVGGTALLLVLLLTQEEAPPRPLLDPLEAR